MQLHNIYSREELIERLENEPFKRITISFYRYVFIHDPENFRNKLYRLWNDLNCLGRVYVAQEGVNAQMSIPEHLKVQFIEELYSIPELINVPIKYAVEDDGKSFYKLIVKVRHKIVGDGLNDGQFDASDVGRHLTAFEFHELMDRDGTLVIDMRNHYESEIGYFEGAYCPDADTFRDAIKIVEDKFAQHKEDKILLYCTGGIRCEKASAYLRYKGFKDVNQLHGGIIEYARMIKSSGMESKFTGKNFVFDNRLGESIDGKVIAKCHQCGAPCDNHTNCANNDCHLLFIQCDACKAKYAGCCSDDCMQIAALPEEERKKYRQLRHQKYAESKIFKSRLRPHLMRDIQNKQLHLAVD